jgi:hypothetical protein
MIEKRAAPRHRVLKGGTLAFDDGCSVDCTVRDMSSSGARIEVANPIGVPHYFTLVIAADQFVRPGHAVWRNEQRIGIAFD